MSRIATEFAADERLAVYGSLRPGAENAHVLAPLAGEWTSGSVRGRLVEAGWAAARGYRAITLCDTDEPVSVFLFCSHDLPAFWPSLDAFEGAEYRRTLVQVDTADETVEAFIYAVSEPVDRR